MKLYLLRHGHSPAAPEAGVPKDSERPLSEMGRFEVSQSVKELLRRGGKPALILHSPLRRAQESAHVAQELLTPTQGSVRWLPLSNVLPAAELYEKIKERTKNLEEALAIGHQPQLGDLAAFLCGKGFEFRTGELWALETTPGGCKALWHSNPREAFERPGKH